MFRHGNKVRSEATRRVLGGERVEEVAGDLGVSQATLYRWKHQGLMGSGRKFGVKSHEPNELERAQRRTKDLAAIIHGDRQRGRQGEIGGCGLREPPEWQ